MQLIDVMKCISKYRAFVALPIQIDIVKNNIATNTSIDIGASLMDKPEPNKVEILPATLLKFY